MSERTKQEDFTNMLETKSCKEAALDYLKKGLSVIPIGTDKKPLFPWKIYTERKPKKEEIEKWWTDNPTAGVAIVTGKISNLTVVDVEYGGLSDYLPATLTIRTGGGGAHFYYRYTPKFKNAVRIRELTDIRNDGGYVVAPPSRHKSGKRYSILKSGGMKITEFPIHLFVTEALRTAKTDWNEVFSNVEKGERNSSAAKVAGTFLTKVPYTFWEQIAWPALKNWNNTACKPPLPEEELRSVFNSISSRVTYQQDDTEKEIKDMPAMIEEYKQKLKEIKAGNVQVVKTGFVNLDSLLNGGWKKGELILIGARPSVGKTSLALTFTKHAAMAGNKVLFFSIEMSTMDIYEKLASFVSNIPTTDIINGVVPADQMEKIFTKTRSLKIDIAELATATSTAVIEIVKKKLLDEKIDLIVIDYLQFLTDSNKNGTDATRVGIISRNLKMLARMTGIPVICPAQLNRRPEENKDKIPQLSNLRDSGNLEADADVVILLHRQILGDSKDEATMIVAKNRKGATGEVKVKFDLRTTQFK